MHVACFAFRRDSSGLHWEDEEQEDIVVIDLKWEIETYTALDIMMVVASFKSQPSTASHFVLLIFPSTSQTLDFELSRATELIENFVSTSLPWIHA